MSDSESPRKAVTARPTAVYARTKIGFRKVRTKYDTGKKKLVLTHSTVSSPCYCSGTVDHKAQTVDTILYFGRNDGQHHVGVAMIIKIGIRNSLMEWKPVIERFL